MIYRLSGKVKLAKSIETVWWYRTSSDLYWHVPTWDINKANRDDPPTLKKNSLIKIHMRKPRKTLGPEALTMLGNQHCPGFACHSFDHKAMTFPH